MGGVLLPAGILLPAWLTANAQTASSFDFYVSPSGSDSNPGTVSQPWAITSLMSRSPNYAKTTGKRIGFLPGTYDVSGHMQDDSHTGAIQIDGGSAANPTYYGSSDSNGNYSRGTALITAKTPSGLYGGGVGYPGNGPILAHTGSTPHATGNIVIDGLRFTGYSYKGIRIGGLSSGDGPVITGSVLVTNCEFFGQGQNAGATRDNEPSIWIDGCQTNSPPGPFVITNNYFHDNYPNSTTGQSSIVAVQVWQCWGVQITYNTSVTSGGFWGKDGNNQGNTVAYNYVDNTKFTSSPDTVYGAFDFQGYPTTGLTQTSSFHHNIIIGLSGFWLAGNQNYAPFTTPLKIYNNTIVLNSPGTYPAIWAAGQSTNAGKIAVYNNIITGRDSSGYGTFHTSPRAIGIWDYNGYGASNTWNVVADGASGGYGTQYSSAAAFASAIAAAGGVGGCESHGVASTSPQFAATGTFAQQYQLQATSPFKARGSTTGTTAGTACDMGAWGNGATQIGCNFNSSAPAAPPVVPKAPSLTVS